MKRQKPSERIKEIAIEKYSPIDFSSHIKALEDYLDEEYEKQQNISKDNSLQITK